MTYLSFSHSGENPKIEPLCSRIWEGNQRGKNHKGFMHTPPPNLKEKGLKTATRNSLRKGSKNHQKWRNGRDTTKPFETITVHTMKVHTKSSLAPDHPSLTQDLTMKLSI
jgi:hypothetical protein